MFRLLLPPADPTNCPYCLYAPVSHSDLRAHVQTHSEPQKLLQCTRERCGFMYVDQWEAMEHVLMAHGGKGVEKMSGDQGIVGKLLVDTHKYFSDLRKLASASKRTESESLPTVSGESLPVASLLLHSQSLLQRCAPPCRSSLVHRTTHRRKRAGSPLAIKIAKKRPTETSSKVSTASSPRSETASLVSDGKSDDMSE